MKMMLQWGHDRMIVERRAELGVSAAEAALQWGHDRMIVESFRPVPCGF